jgi:DNA-binding beta-propeller fold protein YncE
VGAMDTDSVHEGTEFAVEAAWPEVPGEIKLNDVAGVAVDQQDRVYVFSRSLHPVSIFSSAGKFVGTWGAGIFARPHGIDIGPDGAVYCTDDGDHTVRKFSADGELLLEIGAAGQPSEYMSGKPFNRCTHTALSPDGEIYVSDGYHNHSVHKYSPAGEWLQSWGQSGVGPGEFNLPHNIACDADGFVYVADRENHRVQVFGGDGAYIREWRNVHRPCALSLTHSRDPQFLIGEIGPVYNFNRAAPNLGPRVSILDRDGELITRIGSGKPESGALQFTAPHGIAMDSSGAIYVGEPVMTTWRISGEEGPAPDGVIAVRKIVPIA